METITKKSKWYLKWWGIVLIILAILFILFSVGFLKQFFRYREAMKTGDIITNTVLWGSSRLEGLNTNSEPIIRRDELEGDDGPFLGSTNPKMTIVVFSDFQCPYCAIFYPALKQFVIENDKQVKLIFRDFLLDDIKPAMAGRCAKEQDKFWQMHDKLFDYQDSFSDNLVNNIAENIGLNMGEFNSCYATDKYIDQIGSDFLLGTKAGVVGTPTSFINGEKFPGVMSKSILEQILEAVKTES